MRYFLVFVFAVFSFTVTDVRAAEMEAKEITGQSVYHAKSAWENQDGKAMTLRDLRGKPVVAAMFYTTCHSACPIIILDIKNIEKQLSPELKDNVQFVVFSFDAEKDQSSALKTFATKNELDLKRWTLLHGTTAGVRELAALLGVNFKPLKEGGFDHSNVITILDKEGVIKHQQIGLGQKPEASVAVLESMLSTKSKK